MSGLLQTLNAARDIEFEKCGDIIWAPKRNIFVCCCWHCQEFFTGMLAFMRHVKQHRELYDWGDDENYPFDEEEQEDEEKEVTNVFENRENLVSVYMVEELLADEMEVVCSNSEQLLEQELTEKGKNELQLAAKTENAIGNLQSPKQGGAEMVDCTAEVLDSREYGENSFFMCELKGEEISVNVCNEYDNEISALLQSDTIETIEYSVEEVEQILEADNLLSATQVEYYEHNNEPLLPNVDAKQTSMDSGLCLEETIKISSEIKRKSNESLNLMVGTDLSKPAIVKETAKKLDVPIKLVEAFYKDFKPRSQRASIKFQNKCCNLPINNNAIKNWNMHSNKSICSDDKNRPNMSSNNNNCNSDHNIRNNNVGGKIYNQTNLNASDKLFTLNTVGDKALSLVSSTKPPNFVSNAVDSEFLAALQLTANSCTHMALMKQEVLAQSTPKVNLRESVKNEIAGLRSDHFNMESTVPKEIYSSFKFCPKLTQKNSAALLVNPYKTRKSLLLERTPFKCITSSHKQQVWQRMQRIRRALLQATNKENQPKNPGCDISEVTASNKQLAPNNTLPKILSVEVLNSGNVSQSDCKDLAASKSAAQTASSSVGNVSNVSVEFLQQHSVGPIVNLSAFDCILNNVTYNSVNTSTAVIDTKPNTSLEIIKIDEDIELVDGFPKPKFSFQNIEQDSSLTLNVTTADSSQSNLISSSAAIATTTAMDDIDLLDIVGLKIIKNPELECELPLAQVEAMRSRASQFAAILQKTSEIWINKFQSHELVDSVFARLTAETNASYHCQLATHHLKRMVNLIIMWYSCCYSMRLLGKKSTPTALASYLLFFEFLPKTGRRCYYCEFCSQYFRAETRYLQHRTEHTGQQPYSCQRCQHTYVRRKSLQNHELNCCKSDSKCDGAATVSETKKS